MSDLIKSSDEDVHSKLATKRMVFLTGEITMEEANRVCANLLYLDSIGGKDSGKEISFLINSPGGDIDAFFAIYDTFHYISSPVKTICIKQACSAAALLLAAGTPGLRFAFPHSEIMIHDISLCDLEGNKKEIHNEIKALHKSSKIFLKILAEHTGRTFRKVQKDCEHDFYMTANEAVKYGIIDGVIGKKASKKIKE